MIRRLQAAFCCALFLLLVSPIFVSPLARPASAQSTESPILTDTRALVEIVLPLIQRLLQERGAFDPFALVMRSDGELAGVDETVGSEAANKQEFVTAINLRLKAHALAGDLRATAVAFDVELTSPETGETRNLVVVNLDHHDKYSAILVVPYDPATGSLDLDGAVIEEGTHDIFP